MNTLCKCAPCRCRPACSRGVKADHHFSEPASAARAALGLGDLLLARFLGGQTPVGA